MSSHLPTPPHPPTARTHSAGSRFRRSVRLWVLRARRILRNWSIRITLFTGWTWVAAVSLIGFESLEIVFGSFILAPEFLPLAILTLAGIWYVRERIRGATRRSARRRRGGERSP